LPSSHFLDCVFNLSWARSALAHLPLRSVTPAVSAAPLRSCHHLSCSTPGSFPAGGRAPSPSTPTSPPAVGSTRRTGGSLTGSILPLSSPAKPPSRNHPPSPLLPAHATRGGTAAPSAERSPDTILRLVRPSRWRALDDHPSLPAALPGLVCVQPTPMPMAAGGEVFQLPNAPTKTSGVPEDVSILGSMLENGPTRRPFNKVRRRETVLPVTVGKVCSGHRQLWAGDT